MPATPSWRYFTGTGGAITYNKTALWLHTLERHIGWPRLRRGMSLFFTRSRFTHPTPEDLFAALSEGAGRDLSWYFDQVYRSSNTFDYAVSQLTTTAADRAAWVVDGGARRFADGSSVTRRRGGRRSSCSGWARRCSPSTCSCGSRMARRRASAGTAATGGSCSPYDRPAAAVSAEVDPNHVLLLDVNRTNNSRTLEPLAPKAGRQWAGRWWVWLQDLAITYGFFV